MPDTASPTSSRLSALAQRATVKALAVGLAFAMHAFAYFALHPVTGPAIAAAIVLPVSLAGWFFGPRAGVIVAGAGVLLNGLLAAAVGSPDGFLSLVRPAATTGVIVTLVLGYAAGRVSELRASLRRERDQTRGIIEGADVAMLQLRRDGRITLLNPKARALMGRDDVTVETALALVHPDDRASTAEKLSAFFERGEPLAELELRMRTTEGQRNVVWRTSVLHEDGQPDALLVFGLDVTEARDAERRAQALARRENALATLSAQALAAGTADAFMQAACETVAHTLDVDCVELLEHVGAERAFVFRGAHGWGDVTVGARLAQDVATHASFALGADEPLAVADVATDGRFASPAFLVGHGIASSLSVRLRLRERTWGILAIHARRARTFTAEEARFLQRVAHETSSLLLRIETEEATRAGEQRFRLAAQSASDLIYEWDVATGRVDWFGNIDDALGYAPGAFPRTIEAWETVVHPEDRKTILESVHRALEETDRFEGEYRVVRPDGSVRRWIDRGRIVRDAAGAPRTWVGVTSDVTELRASEEALAESEERFRSLVETSFEGIAIHRDGIILDTNTSFATLYGYPRDELIGKHVRDLVVAEDHKRIAVEMDRPVSNIYDVTGVRKDGTRLRLEVAARRAQYQGRPARVVAVRDVTARHAMEAALRESEARFRSLFEEIPIGVYRTTPEGKVVLANPALVGMLGFDDFEALAREVDLEGAAETDYSRATFRERLERDGEIRGFEARWRRADGTYIDVRENARAVRDADGRIAYYEGTVEDVSERKLAERALLEQLALNDALVRTQSDLGVGLLVAEEGHVLFANETACTLSGRTRSEILTLPSISALFAPGSRELVETEVARRFAGAADPAHAEERILRGDGQALDVEVSLMLMRFEGRPRIVAFFRDITARKRAESALRESEERFRTMADAIDEAYFIQDAASGQFLYVNAGFEKMWGRPAADLLADPGAWMQAVDPAHRDRVQRAKQRGHHAPADMEYRIVRPDGTARWVNDRSFPVAGASGEPTRVVGIVADITSRKAAEDRFRSASSYARSLLEASLDAIVTVGADGRILDVNRAMEVLTGRPRELIVGSPFAERFTDPTRAAEACSAVLREGEAKDVLLAIVRGGERTDVLLNATVLRDANGNFQSILATARDITDRLRLEREAASQREAMSRNERLSSLGTLVAGVAHEINNPLTYLQGNIELALLDLEDVQGALQAAGIQTGLDLDGTRQGLQSALGGAERISHITKALKAVARQRPSTEREVVDVTGVLYNVEALVKVGIPDSVNLRFHMPHEPLLVRGQASELHQVLLNLTSNAIDAVRGSGGNVDVRAEAAGDNVEIVVEDDGPGIPPDVVPKLFTPFFTTKAHGTGLGLSIVHSIVRDHGGEVAVENPKHGVLFRVRLPRIRQDASGPPAAGRTAS